MKPLNITAHFLAHTLTGKTCLMAGMYAKFKRNPHGFRLFTVDATYKADDDLDLDLTELWDNIESGVYPERTGETDAEGTRTYHFELQHNKIPLIQFDWLDYRGGVVSARSNATDRAGFRTQIDKVQANGCLLIGISAEHLLKPIENDPELLKAIKKKAWVERMEQLTKDISSSTPAVFVITKSDLTGYERRSPEGVVNDLRRLFPDWFKPGNNRLAMVCPVSVVNGKNLEYPLIFAAWTALIKEHIGSNQHLDKAQRNYNSQFDDGLGSNLQYGWDSVFGPDGLGWTSGKYKKDVDALYSTRNTAQGRVYELQEQIKPLAEALVPMITFRDGKEMSDDEKRSIYTFSSW